jgi:hypothetical protein
LSAQTFLAGQVASEEDTPKGQIPFRLLAEEEAKLAPFNVPPDEKKEKDDS